MIDSLAENVSVLFLFFVMDHQISQELITDGIIVRRLSCGQFNEHHAVRTIKQIVKKRQLLNAAQETHLALKYSEKKCMALIKRQGPGQKDWGKH